VSPAGQAQVFFDALLGGNGELLTGCYLTVSTIVSAAPEPRTQWVPAQVDPLVSAVLRTANGPGVTGVYVGTGLTRGRSSDAGRLTVADTIGLAYLSADIDIAGGAHGTEKPYAPDLDTALALAHCLGLTPTVITHTGHGVQAFYRLADPWIFGAVDADDDGVPIIDESKVDADRSAAEELAWGFVTSLRIRARQLGGWHIDPTGDLARLMRAAGSTNRKVVGEELPVYVIDHDATRVYDREQFEGVFAPRTLLDPYRVGAMDPGTELAGVDLAGLWAQVQGAKNFTPPWLESVLESGWDDALCRIWSGEEDKRYHNDDSEIDMALVAAVLRLELGAERAAQAVMARRCRLGRKIEKVDPAERVDYLDRTVKKVAARIRARETIAESSDAVIDAVLGAGDEPPSDDDPPGGGASPAAEATTQVGGQGPTPNENTVSLGGRDSECKENAVSLHSVPDNASEPEPEPPTPLRRSDPAPDPEAEHKDAPYAPRQGIDPSIPAPPTQAQRNIGAQLAAQMGLPPGVAVYAVGIRRMERADEIRLWLVRSAESIVHGGGWRVNTVGSTRWHPKSEWETGTKVAGIVWRDLHLVIEPAPPRAWRDEGRTRLYQLARRMLEGTPAEMVRRSVVGMLRHAAGSSLFSTAVVTRDPWVTPDKVWVALDAIRQAISHSGFAPLAASKLMDTLDELGCKPQTGMEVEEETRTVFDELPWVWLGKEMFTGQLEEHVRMRAADRDAQDARSGLRMIGPS
jgi:hypothetical protein